MVVGVTLVSRVHEAGRQRLWTVVRGGDFCDTTQSHGFNLPGTEAGNYREAHGIFSEYCWFWTQHTTSNTVWLMQQRMALYPP